MALVVWDLAVTGGFWPLGCGHCVVRCVRSTRATTVFRTRAYNGVWLPRWTCDVSRWCDRPHLPLRGNDQVEVRAPVASPCWLRFASQRQSVAAASRRSEKQSWPLPAPRRLQRGRRCT